MNTVMNTVTLIPLLYILFGLVFGSFLTVCIYRLPFISLLVEQKLESEKKLNNLNGVVAPLDAIDVALPQIPMQRLTVNDPPRSFCPSCFKQLSWWHNIPFFSWVLLKGRCAFCKVSISVRYPLIEITTGLFALLTFSTFGVTPTGIIIFAFCCALIVITVIDYDYYIIPNSISLPGIAVGLIVAATNHFFHIFNAPIASGMRDSLLGILSGAGFLLFISEFYIRVRKIEGLGMGDVKLLAMTGALLGMECSIFTIFVGSILGAVIGITMILVRGRSMSHPLPFGPYLAGATLIYIFGGPNVIPESIELLGKLGLIFH